jgi:hypothetical protein
MVVCMLQPFALSTASVIAARAGFFAAGCVMT